MISCNEAYRLTGDGHLKKWLVARVRQKVGQRRRSHDVAPVLDMVQESHNLVYSEPELGTAQDFIVFGQNTRVET